MKKIKVAFLSLVVTALTPISTSLAQVCNGQCDNGNSYAVSSFDGQTKVTTFNYSGGEGDGLNTYYVDESTTAACSRLAQTYCS